MTGGGDFAQYLAQTKNISTGEAHDKQTMFIIKNCL